MPQATIVTQVQVIVETTPPQRYAVTNMLVLVEFQNLRTAGRTYGPAAAQM